MKAPEATICIGKFVRHLRKKRIPILQNPFLENGQEVDTSQLGV